MIGDGEDAGAGVGRHSIPDPEDSSDGPPEGAERCDRVVRPAAGPAARRSGLPARGSASRSSRPDTNRTTTTSTATTSTATTSTSRSDRDVPDYLQTGHREPDRVRRAAHRRRGHLRRARSTPATGKAASGPAATARSNRAGGASASASSARWSPSSWWSAAFILWRFFGDALSNRSTLAAARCVDGQKSPSPSSPIRPSPTRSQTLAKKFNETAEPGRRPLRRARRQTRRLRPGGQRLRRQLARRAR